MTKDEALQIVRDLLAQRLAELEKITQAQEPAEKLPACIRRQLHEVERWREIVAGVEPGPDDMPGILAVISSELEKRQLARKIVRGPFASVVDEAIHLAALEWERLDNARLAMVLPQAAATLCY